MPGPAPVLLAAIGNELMGDDALGPLLIRRIACFYEIPAELELADAGTASHQLMDLMAGRRAAVLVDALQLDSQPAGTVLRFGRDHLLAEARRRFSPHQPALREAILAAEALGGRMEQVVLLGVAAESLEMGVDLSEPVRAAMPRLEEAVLTELRALGVEPRRRSEFLE